MELSPQHTAVRVQRMKAQLEAARVVVGALAADPPCVLLEDMLVGWDGVPSTLWRKRLARHARECTVCSGHGSGLVPAEGLLVGLALLPVAGAVGSMVAPELLPTAAHLAAAPAAGAGRAERRRGQVRRRRRNSAIAAVVAVAALGTGGAAVHLYTDGEDRDAATLSAGTPSGDPTLSTEAAASSAPTTASPSASSASPSASASASASPSPSRKPEPKPSPTKSTRPPAPSSAAPAPQPPPPPAPAPPTSEGDQVLQIVNAERAKEGAVR